MNKIILLGRLTKDPEIKESNGTSFCRFGLAVDRRFAKDKDAADFFNCTAFGKTADFCAKFFSKGLRVLIDGRMQFSNYKDKDGTPKSFAEVIIDNAEFADGKREPQPPKPIDDNNISELDTPF